jgi:hypothetical protein
MSGCSPSRRIAVRRKTRSIPFAGDRNALIGGGRESYNGVGGPARLLPAFAVSGSGNAGAAASQSGRITIPAAVFAPTTDNVDYTNLGYCLSTSGAAGTFVAPLSFSAGVVRIRRLNLHGFDNAPWEICLSLWRVAPAATSLVGMGGVCTTNVPANQQVATTSAVEPRRVNTPAQAPYLSVTVPPRLSFCGAAALFDH